MKKTRSLLLLLLIYFITCSVDAQDKRHSYPFFIVQMSDPQFGFFDNNRSFDKETELYEKAVKAINRIKPAFVVITGDFVNDRSDQAQWNEFIRITDEIDSSIPVWLTPGNHDIGQAPVKDDIDKYIAEHCYDRFSFRYKKCLFIGINSCIIKSGENEFEQVQYDWLKNELAGKRRARQTILFCHYPFFIKSPDEPESYSNIGIGSRSKYLDLFREYDVSAVYSGHLHNNAVSASGETEFIVTSAVGKPLGEAPSGLRIIKVYQDRIEHKYYSLDEIPERIMFTGRVTGK
jgi:3',5'-cyclic AMP phosphodiesterase CpdA